MVSIKKKSLISTSTLLATVALTGCATAPQFETTLTEPRPQSQERSYAMQVAMTMKNTVNCLGCEDTVLWNNEKDLVGKVGFNVVENTHKEFHEAENYYATIRKLHREGKLTKDTLPPAPKLLTAPKARSGGNNLTTGLMVADSLDGKWTNPGSSLGLGLALGVVGSMLSSKPTNLKQDPPTKEMKALFVLPPEQQIRFELFKHYPTPEENQYNNIAVYAGKQFVELLTKSAIDMGYKPVGDIQVRTLRLETNPDWTYIWQPLENEAVGCPKVTAKTHRWDMCRVEWARYTVSGENTRYTWHLEKSVVPKILGGNGKDERWIQEFGYNRLEPSGLIVDDATNLSESDGDRNYRFAIGLQKHLKPGQFIYVPSYELSNGKWSTQSILTNKGIHYFSVVVPETSPQPAP